MSDEAPRERLFEDERIYRLYDLMQERMPDQARFGLCVAVGLVASIRDWLAEQAPSGRVSQFSSGFLAEIIEWEGNPDEMIQLLRDAGYLDDQGQFIGWDEMVSGSVGFRSWIRAINEEE